MSLEFKSWEKIPRLRRDVTISEKIDGTNAAIVILPRAEGDYDAQLAAGELLEVGAYVVAAQSRKRLIQPGKGTDNYGFAQYVWENAEAFVTTLGQGYHYGEWYGQGIQRGYGLTEKRFALFNAPRWEAGKDAGILDDIPGLGIVPVLFKGQYYDGLIGDMASALKQYGSQAVPGYMNPEGLVMWHSQSRDLYKIILGTPESGMLYDDGAKGSAE